MEQFKLHINLDNDAFTENLQNELSRLLVKVATDITNLDTRTLKYYQNIWDINGNIVGQYAVKETITE